MALGQPLAAASVSPALLEFLRRSGLAQPGETPHAETLSGGVSSDIWRVDLAGGPICVKRALSRLRVAQVWEAPVERNRYERKWMETAATAAPGAVPKILAFDDEAGLFAMQYLDPARHPVWKALLRDGRADPAFAARVGATLCAIHASTAGSTAVAQRFPTDAIFHAIRLEPYLEATAAAHPDFSHTLFRLSKRTAATRLCLVHGDVSPKNILSGPAGPVFLDAECAWYGDPAFDLAFCLNHLLLKCLWVPEAAPRFLDCFDALAGSYLMKASWEKAQVLENRAASLLPGLLLARVDGKSPVEYLTQDAQKQRVRRFAREFLAHPPRELSAIRQAWQESST
jgi:aminoglycoside phosphotransferase (APT) family kinase protein